MRTTFFSKTGHSQIVCTEFAQLDARTPDRRVRFHVTIRHRTSNPHMRMPASSLLFSFRLLKNTGTDFGLDFIAQNLNWNG
jgi:hypothetical protein